VVVFTNQSVGVVARKLGIVTHLVAGSHLYRAGRQVKQFAGDSDLEDFQLILAGSDVIYIGVDPVHKLHGIVSYPSHVIGRAWVRGAEGVPPLVAVRAAHAIQGKLHTWQVQQLLVAVYSSRLSRVVGVA